MIIEKSNVKHSHRYILFNKGYFIKEANDLNELKHIAYKLLNIDSYIVIVEFPT